MTHPTELFVDNFPNGGRRDHEDQMRRLFGDPKLLDGYMDYIYQRMEELERKSEEREKNK